MIKAHLGAVEENPDNLQTALTELLEGPYRQLKSSKASKVSQHPVFLIIDAFEQALEDQQGSGRRRLKSCCVESIRATIKAFDRAATDSRLLFTGRFQFTLPENGLELADLLLDVSLPPMERYESEKQFAAKISASEDQRITKAGALWPSIRWSGRLRARSKKRRKQAWPGSLWASCSMSGAARRVAIGAVCWRTLNSLAWDCLPAKARCWFTRHNTPCAG